MSDEIKKTERFYWLKMERRFMDKHYIKILRKMGGPERGAQFTLFYISLLLESIDHNGDLRYDGDKPYTNELLSLVTGFEIEIVNDAMKIFYDTLGLAVLKQDGTIHMTKLQDMVGSETNWAKTKRAYRAQENETESGQCQDNVRQSKSKSKSIEKEEEEEEDTEKDLSIEKKIIKENGIEKYSDEWIALQKEKMRQRMS